MIRRDELLKLAGEFLVLEQRAFNAAYARRNEPDGGRPEYEIVLRAKRDAHECAELADKLGVGK